MRWSILTALPLLGANAIPLSTSSSASSPVINFERALVHEPVRRAGNEDFISTRRLAKRDTVDAATAGISAYAFTSPSTGISYLSPSGPTIETYTLAKSAGSFGASAAEGYVPVTVLDVDALGTAEGCEGVDEAFKTWAAVDDVWTSEVFMKGVVLNGASSADSFTSLATCFEAYNTSFIAVKGDEVPSAFASESMGSVASFFADGDGVIPPGPYMARLSTTENRLELSKVYRVYHDEQQAFTSPAIPSVDGSTFYDLTTTALVSGGMNTLSIPVPSRIYSLNRTTEARPLEGVRVAVKDIYDLAGFRTGCGNRAHWNLYEPAVSSAPTVQRLIDAGAVIVGKVKTSQFANGAAVSAGWFDQMAPYNPRGDGYQSPSTSSSGSAAGVAAYPWLDYALGSDTGGSIRFPAGACGVFGLRASWGALSLEGVMPMAAPLDAPGFFARNGAALAKLGRSWFADTLAARAYEAFPSVVRAPSDLLNVAGPAGELLSTFVSNLSGFLNATVDSTSFYGQWNETIGQDVGMDMLSYANQSWTVFVGYYQYNYFGVQFIEDYEAAHEGRTPAMDATVQVRWGYGNDQGIEGYNAALDVKAHVKEFAERYITPNSSTTCSETLFVYPQAVGRTSYRNVFPAYPTPAFGYSPVYHAIYAEEPEITIPIGQVPYNSTVSGVTEYLPVTVNINAARGCDYMLFDLAEKLHDAGIIGTVKTGSYTF
ncbi:hypothetical protein JCM6882_005463 [Rhodosporidiobolus microsporus]